MESALDDAIDWKRFNAAASDDFYEGTGLYAFKCPDCGGMFIECPMRHELFIDATDPKKTIEGWIRYINGGHEYKCPACESLWYPECREIRWSHTAWWAGILQALFGPRVIKEWRTISATTEDVRNSEWGWILR